MVPRRFCCLLLGCASLLSVPSIAASSVTSVYTEILGRTGKDWVQLSRSDFPENFRDPSNPINQSVFVSAFGLRATNTMIVFEFSKPKADSKLPFCRSRINVNILYNFNSDHPYWQQPRTGLGDAMELVQFRSSRQGCTVSTLDDLSHYVLVRDPLGDGVLMQLWHIFNNLKAKAMQSSTCKIGDAVLTQVSIGPAWNDPERNGYTLFAEKDKEIYRIDLSSAETPAILFCGQTID